MKRFFKGFIAGVSALSIGATAMAATFSDVKGTAYEWALSYIEDMAEKGLISGYEDGTFKPEVTVSKIETISLFARAMGSRSEVNAAAVEAALLEYSDLIDSFKLNFGKEDVAFMLYRGVLTEDEAAAYLKGDAKNAPMLRYEAATIITKAMGGEAEAKKNLVLDLEYTDVSEIPPSAKKYVYYVTDKGVMSGMGDGNFSPNTAVLRSQIAVMLSKTVNIMNISFNEVTVKSVDTEKLTITVADADGAESSLSYSENTLFYLEGDKATAKDIPSGAKATVTSNTDGVLYVDVTIPDETVTAIYNSFQNKDGVLYVIATAPNSTESTTYECVQGITNITKDGEKATILKLAAGDYLELVISKGKVTSITAVNKTTTINNATIEALNLTGTVPTITISHKDADYNGIELEVSGNASVMKEGESVPMTNVYRGDKVILTLEYGIVTSVVASSDRRSVTGTIRAVNISSNPTITVLIDGNEVQYDVTSSIKIFVNGETATLYDFRVGDKVTLTTESNAVTKIETTSTQATEGNVNGTVLAVNSSFGFIKVSVTDESGNTYEENIYYKDNKTAFITAGGATKTSRDIKAGNVISVYGTSSNGAFEATSVIIVK